MRLAKVSVPALVTAAMVAGAASAHADPDTDLNNQLHSYVISRPPRLQRMAGQDHVRTTTQRPRHHSGQIRPLCVDQPAARRHHGPKLPIPRRCNQHLLP